MQHFKSETGQCYAFDDNVTATLEADGTRSFTYMNPVTKTQEPLDVPKDLKPYVPDAVTPDIPLVAAINRKKILLQAACSRAISSGFTSLSADYPSDDRSQINIANVCATGGGFLWCKPANSDWRLEKHSAEEAAQVRTDLFKMVQANQQKYAELLDAVNTAKTLEDVAAVVWPNES